MAKNDWNGWIWLEIAQNGWKEIEKGWLYYSFWDLGSTGYQN